MIGRLRGTLVDRQANTVVVDCGGVGYQATVSVYTLASLPKLGDEVTLRIFTQAQENKIALFGFLSAKERAIFDLLITVKNVGPSSAMSILSGGAGPTDIALMIAQKQTPALTKLKGVGKKTAQMIVVELQEKCELLLASWGAQAGADMTRQSASSRVMPSARPAILDDVASAMVQMGWRPNEVDAVVSELVVEEGASIETLLRQALQAMPR